jgi:hypothetical protein
MIKTEINKINHKEVKRFYSDTNHYIKISGTEDLVNEVVVSVDKKIKVVETDIKIEVEENINEIQEDK